MREDERCERCDYVKLALVDAAAFDAVTGTSQEARRRSGAALPLVLSLAESDRAGDWERAFTSSRDSARALLRDLGPAPEPRLIEVEPEVLWRCRVCGAVDAPQECLGICIWRRFEWVSADEYLTVLAEARAAVAHARALEGLVRLLALTQPQAGAWQRNLRALQARAAALLDDRDAAPEAGRAPDAG